MTPKPDKEAPDLPGLTFIKLLGSGGYANVYLYEQSMPKMGVAVKVLSAEGLSDQVLRHFTAEANTMARLADHPNIVQVFRADTTADGRPYLVMKYYPQRNLAARSKAERISVPEVLAIGIRISSAVETAHRAGILHRDIKPANILTSQYGEPGLTDFGIATTKEESSGESEGMSIPWAAPEVLFSTSPADERSDVYALGATLWHLLVGRSPFEIPGGDNSSLAMMRRVREHAPPRTAREDVPQELERILSQAMAKDPSSRPPSALDLAKSLQAIELGQRWNPTALVLLDNVGADGSATNSAYDFEPSPEDRTKLRGAPRIVAQHRDGSAQLVDDTPESRTTKRLIVGAEGLGVKPPSSVVPEFGYESESRERIGIPAVPHLDGTIRRSVVSSPVPEEVRSSTPVSPIKTSSKKVLMAIAVALVAVAATIGVIASSGSHASVSVTTTSPATTDAILAQIGVPNVTVSRTSPTQVLITWTYANAMTGDVFRIRINGGQWTGLSKQSFNVASTTGQTVCAEVQVQRSDGSATSPISPLACGG